MNKVKSLFLVTAESGEVEADEEGVAMPPKHVPIDQNTSRQHRALTAADSSCHQVFPTPGSHSCG